MKIVLTLSARRNGEGMSEIILKANRRAGGSVVTMRAKSGVWTLPEFFDDRVGIDITLRRMVNPQVRMRHIEAKARLDGLLVAVSRAVTEAGDEALPVDWLRGVVKEHLSGGLGGRAVRRRSFADLAEAYIERRRLSPGHVRLVCVVFRAVLRYEGFVRATTRGGGDFTFDVDKVTAEDIENFRAYLKDEHVMAEDYPELYRRMAEAYPEWLGRGGREVGRRGDNTIAGNMRVLRAFFNWLYETGRTRNRPFEGVKVGAGVYGTPYYISVEERNVIASTPMPTKHLEAQRDIFVFQCMVGCRVGDLLRLTPANVLVYAPHKTKDDGLQSRVARVPLHPKAVELMERYRGVDAKGRLFPFISQQRYNDAIKEVFTVAGVTRRVVVRDPLTGENSLRPINELASSHLARRTFIGNAYRLVADPNIIGKMSGHAEGSKAFARYRNIEDETLRGVIEKMG